MRVVENVYDDSANNKREGSAIVILLLCAWSCVIEGFVAFHIEETSSYEKSA